jgi:hypothetical protein
MVCVDCDGDVVSTRQGLFWFGLVGYVAFNEVVHLT